MLTYLFSRPYRPAPVRRARLSLEALDPRLAPSDATPLDPPTGGGDVLIPPVDLPPVIADLTAMEVVGRLCTITGRVIDEQAPGLVVTFEGFQTINDKTATVAEDGTFSLTIQVPQNVPGGQYLVMATTTDRAGHGSNLAYTTLFF